MVFVDSTSQGEILTGASPKSFSAFWCDILDDELLKKIGPSRLDTWLADVRQSDEGASVCCWEGGEACSTFFVFCVDFSRFWWGLMVLRGEILAGLLSPMRLVMLCGLVWLVQPCGSEDILIWNPCCDSGE